MCGPPPPYLERIGGVDWNAHSVLCLNVLTTIDASPQQITLTFKPPGGNQRLTLDK
jgi:hypothetical protein